MAEEFKNAPEEFKNESPKIVTNDESSTTTGEVKDRGLFDFLGKKEEAKPPQETPLDSEFEHKAAQISEQPAFVAKHEEKEHKPTLLDQIHHYKQEEEEEKEHKPTRLEQIHHYSLQHKLCRTDSSSSSSSEEEGEDGEKRKNKKKEKKKKIVEGEEVKTEEEKKGMVDKIKEKLPGHNEKTEDDAPLVNTFPLVNTVPVVAEPEAEKKGVMENIKEKLPCHGKKTEDDTHVAATTVVPVTEETAEHPAEKKGVIEKIKEKLHGKTNGEEEKNEKVLDHA
ncbi:unnamed protein product [Cochlearia groenlandica]